MASFVTPAELSAYTQGKVSASDPRVQPVLDAVSRAIRKYCGWHVGPSQEDTLTLDGPCAYLLQLPTLHLTEIDSIEEEGEVVDVDDYEWSALGDIRRIGYPYKWGYKFRSIEITFTHGFSDYSDVEQVCQQVTAGALASPMGATREQAGSVGVSWGLTGTGTSGGLTFLHRDLEILTKYKLPARW